jgi:transposase
MPAPCVCGQQEFHETTPYYTHQVIELPAIQMQVTHVMLHEARCLQCSRLLKAPLPEAHRGRQTCLAHLIRQARGLAERKEPEVARRGR